MAKRTITSSSSNDEFLDELEGQKNVYLALRGLERAAQLRILRNCAEMLGLKTGHSGSETEYFAASDSEPAQESRTISSDSAVASEDDEGINPVALRWMRRSGFSAKDLQPLFSLGIDEIDLVAKTVPGNSKSKKMRNVLLLKGVAGYLSSGVARVSDEQLREACTHYGAYDQTNFSKTLKALAADVNGSKANGYTLTAHGMSGATELIKDILQAK